MCVWIGTTTSSIIERVKRHYHLRRITTYKEQGKERSTWKPKVSLKGKDNPEKRRRTPNFAFFSRYPTERNIIIRHQHNQSSTWENSSRIIGRDSLSWLLELVCFFFIFISCSFLNLTLSTNTSHNRPSRSRTRGFLLAQDLLGFPHQNP